jgi:hypothetical protein
MADVPAAKPPSDRDLASMAEARTLARAARVAQAQLAELPQERIDAIVDAMAAAVQPQVEALARLAGFVAGPIGRALARRQSARCRRRGRRRV